MLLRVSKLIAPPALFLLISCSGKPHPEPIGTLLKNKQAAVFVFLSTDCPLSQSYAPTLNDLRRRFETNRIEFYAVFAGETSVDDFIATYKITFPVLLDSDFQLADLFGATKTPEVFVVDSERKPIYQGAIDNGSPELGLRRTVITEHYLLDALNSTVQHTDIRLKQTQSVGCFIERRARGAGRFVWHAALAVTHTKGQRESCGTFQWIREERLGAGLRPATGIGHLRYESCEVSEPILKRASGPSSKASKEGLADSRFIAHVTVT